MATLLAVEMRALARHLSILAAQDRYARDLPRAELSLALTEVTACLSVYRTYIRGLDIPVEAKAEVGRALEEARRRRPNLSPSALDFVRQVLLLADAEHLSPAQREARLGFVMRWQQFTGPIVAKGLEDTVFYAYTPLISLNDVGGDPRPYVASRHDSPQFLQDRARSSPYTLNATTTHDTKRAEDVRARINVLSEIPEEWERHLRLWSRLNAPHRRTVGRHRVPDPVEETLLYQTLLGVWPLRQDEIAEFRPRLKEYVIKATREAMVHTRWTRPNFEHEEALTQFVESILNVRKSRSFLTDFLKLQEKISYYGMLNGLSQTLLKIVSPGVPDFYQGSELWDFRLVDPDNRRAVNFGERTRLLESIAKEGVCPNPQFLHCLCQCWRDGRIKLYVVWKALNFRRQHAQLFLDGGYLSIKSHGGRAQNVFALMRYTTHQYLLAAVPRWLAHTKAPMNAENTQKYWRSGFLLLPPSAPRKWFNILTGEQLLCENQSGRASLPLQRLFASFPVALVSGEIGARSPE